MKIYKMAQSGEREIAMAIETIHYVFDNIARDLGTEVNYDKTYRLNASLEKHDPTGPEGDAWIAVSHMGYSHEFHVEKYFDNEHMQNSYGKVETVRYDFHDKEKTLQDVRAALQRVMA